MIAPPKVAVVTGAGSGIGKAAAIALLDAGYCVVLAGRRPDALRQTVVDSGTERRTLVVPTDVTRPEAVNALFARTLEKFARLDLLFNNAGANVRGVLFEDLSFEEWSSVVNVNLHGMFLCAQAAFRVMKAQNPRGGRIINNGSISAHAPRPDSAPYTATKHAVTGLTKSISLDGRKYDIACGQIDIGNAQIDPLAKLPKAMKQANGQMLAEPMMDLAQVADAIVHMASLPLSVNVPQMTIMPTGMPGVGRG